METMDERPGPSTKSRSELLCVPVEIDKNIKRHSIHGINENIDKIRPYQEIIRLLSEEKQFLMAVERGDVAMTRKILEDNRKRTKNDDEEEQENVQKFNMNCIDPLGRSAVMMAIENENLEMMKLLMEHNVDIQEALLCAISEQFVEAVEALLDYEEKNHIEGTPYSWESTSNNTALFTRDITPLILAAHRNNYEIIKILLDKGAAITIPHFVKCGCPDCDESQRADSLQHSYSRINAYRALSSSSFIALSSSDPILTTFELSWELRKLCYLEHEFKSEYQDLRIKCQDFATALLDHVRTSAELEIILNHDRKTDDQEYGHKNRLERLKLAVKFKQKRFVAHPNVQQLLASMWYEGLPGFRRKNFTLQLWKIISIGLLFPMFSVIYIFAPRSRFGSILRKPFIKFICHSASYMTFLLLLVISSMKHNDNMKQNKHVVEFLIMLWVFGFIWSEIKEFWREGFKEYFRNLWNVLDVMTNLIYLFTFFWGIIIAAYDVQKDHWIHLIYDASFSTANIFSALKLVYIFSVNPYLGPLQIVLSRMIIDIAKFLLWYVLVLFAFSCGIYQLLGQYEVQEESLTNKTSNNNYTIVESSRLRNFSIDHNDTNAVRLDKESRAGKFSNLFETIQTLFWSAFGVIDLTDNFELHNISAFTKFWGMLTFGTFCVISIVVLLNLLIAMMNHSYQHIFDDVDVEWKFARSRLWISFFSDGGSAPPPFNIIPTPKSCLQIIQKIRKCCCQKFSVSNQIIMARQQSTDVLKFQAVTRNLVKRYIMAEQKRTGDHAFITLDDINEVKQDISAFRYELLDILKNHGMNVTTVNDSATSCGNKRRRKTPNYINMHTDGFEEFRKKQIDTPTTDSSPTESRIENKSTFSGFFPSVFYGRQTKSSYKQKKISLFNTDGGKSSGAHLARKSKCESLEKLFERGTVVKYRQRSNSEENEIETESQMKLSKQRNRRLKLSKRESFDVESGMGFIDEHKAEEYQIQNVDPLFSPTEVHLETESVHFRRAKCLKRNNLNDLNSDPSSSYDTPSHTRKNSDSEEQNISLITAPQRYEIFVKETVTNTTHTKFQ